MAELLWDGSLSVQVDEVDEDHRRLVELFNLLQQAVAEGESAEYLGALVEELISGTQWHFRHEERLMLKYQYGALEAHRAEHNELIDSVRQLQQQLLSEGKGVSIDEIRFLEQWLTGHILGADMEMGTALAEVM